MSGIQVTLPLQTIIRLMVAAQSCQNATMPSNWNSSSDQTTESQVLPSGYVTFPEYGLAYKLFEIEVSYNEAMSLCSNENGQLAVIDSKEKVDKILDHFSFLNAVWVGLILLRDTEGWTTIDGKFRNNLPWAIGEPSGIGRCGSLSKWSKGLFSQACDVTRKYLCETALLRN